MASAMFTAYGVFYTQRRQDERETTKLRREHLIDHYLRAKAVTTECTGVTERYLFGDLPEAIASERQTNTLVELERLASKTAFLSKECSDLLYDLFRFECEYIVQRAAERRSSDAVTDEEAKAIRFGWERRRDKLLSKLRDETRRATGL